MLKKIIEWASAMVIKLEKPDILYFKKHQVFDHWVPIIKKPSDWRAHGTPLSEVLDETSNLTGDGSNHAGSAGEMCECDECDEYLQGFHDTISTSETTSYRVHF